MEREIVLSSYSVKNIGSNKPENFVTKFTKPIFLDSNKEYSIGLNSIINMSFTWFNVNAGYNNQLIKFSSDGGQNFQNIEFSAGVWNYIDFNNFIKSKTVVKKDGEEDEYPISLEFNDVTFRVLITMNQNYQLDLTHSNFNELIGFNKVVLKEADNLGIRTPNLSQDTDMLNIHCDLINESLVDGVETDIIYSFSTSVLKPSYSFTKEPRRVTFNPVNKTTISSMRIYITDGKRRLIDLNGADTAFSLILKLSK